MTAVETPSLPPRPSRKRGPKEAVCPVCGGTRLHYLFSVGDSRVVSCKDCLLMLRDPRTTEEAGGTEPAEGEAVAVSTGGKRLADDLRRYRGRADGRMLSVTPPHAGFAREPEGGGLEVTPVHYGGAGSLEQAAGGRLFDVVALRQVAETVADPEGLLREARAVLAPGGVLVVTVAPFDAWSAKQFRRRWKLFRNERRCYFTRATLETLVIHSGFGEIIARHGGGGAGAEGLTLLARPREERTRERLSVVMPVYNEARTFAANFEKVLAKEVEGLDVEIVVVESGSTDGTREIVQRYEGHPKVTVVWEDRPRGKGRAVRSGLERITGDYVLIQDADLEYDLEDYEALLEPLVQGHTAFVLGARHGGSAWKMRSFSGQPVVSAVLNLAHWFFTMLVNVGFGARMKDPFTMYKVFRRDCLHGLEFECNRFDFDFELVIKLLRKGYQPLEIPVNYRSRSFAEGKKVSFFGDPVTWLRVLLKLRLERMDVLANVERQRRQESAGERVVCPRL